MGVNGAHFGRANDAVLVFPVDTVPGDNFISQTLGAYKAPRDGFITDVTLCARQITHVDAKLGVNIGTTVVVAEVTLLSDTPTEATVITANDANVFAKNDVILAVVSSPAVAAGIRDGTIAVGVTFT